MNKIYLDFETYYDTEVSLSKITTLQYVHHPDFKIWGVGVKLNDEPTEWYGEDDYLDALQQIPWEDCAVICHNTLFDAYILTQHLGLYPAYYYDTAAMARGLYPNQSAALKAVAERVFPNDETMRKGEELVNAKGIRDLPPDIEEQIAGYCIQDVDLTYAIFNKFIQDYPTDELDVIDLTCRMYVEPKLTLNRELLLKHLEDTKVRTAQLIEDSGVTREVLASQKKQIGRAHV